MLAAQAETGLACAGLVLEPPFSLVFRETEQALVEGVQESVQVAKQLGAPGLILTTGNVLADESWDQHFPQVQAKAPHAGSYM